MINNDVKIFLAYHKDSIRIKSDIFTPIHVGRNISSIDNRKNLSDIIGDDTGDNISYKNKNYCELTAQYWVWKNYHESEYVGFMHYRRLLNFNLEKHYDEDKWGCCCDTFFSEYYKRKYFLDDKHVREVTRSSDIITVEPWDVNNAGSKNLYDHYEHSDKKLFIKDYDNALDILRKKYPNYSDDIDIYNRGNYGYFTNIFIMKRNIYDEYCSWLFDILFELEKISDISNYNFQEARIYGYISEWLFGIFITHIKRLNKYKVLELQKTIINNTDKLNECINVCFSCDNRYAKYLGVTITSILVNKNYDESIHMFVLDGGITEENKTKIKSYVNSYNNTKIDFINIDTSIFKNCPLDTIPGTHLSLATYYRLILSSIINLDKILYLDCDIVVTSSLRELYCFDLADNYLAGVIDILFKDNTNRLGLSKYVSAGVILLNLKAWRRDRLEEKFFNFIKQNYSRILYHDQDVINCVCQEKICYVDKIWNAQTCEYQGAYDGGWNEIGNNANIIHFISDRKPWIKGNRHPFKDQYEKYLMMSPFKDSIFKFYINYILDKIIRVRRTNENIKYYFLGFNYYKEYHKDKNFRYVVAGIPLFSCRKSNYELFYQFLFFKYKKIDEINLIEDKVNVILNKSRAIERNVDSDFKNNIALYRNGNFNRNKKIKGYMIKSFDIICQNHNIKYWLDSETLKECILYGYPVSDKYPAIGMTRTNYNIFCHAMREQHEFKLSRYAWMPRNENQSMICNKFIFKEFNSIYFIDVFVYDICSSETTKKDVINFKNKYDDIIKNLDMKLYPDLDKYDRHAVHEYDDNFTKYLDVYSNISKSFSKINMKSIIWGADNYKKDVDVIEYNDVFPLQKFISDDFTAMIPKKSINYLTKHYIILDDISKEFDNINFVYNILEKKL